LRAAGLLENRPAPDLAHDTAPEDDAGQSELFEQETP